MPRRAIQEKSETIKSSAAKDGAYQLASCGSMSQMINRSSAIQFILSKGSRIDVLVNSAEYGLRGAVKDIATHEMKALYAINVLDVLRISQGSSNHEKARPKQKMTSRHKTLQKQT